LGGVRASTGRPLVLNLAEAHPTPRRNRTIVVHHSDVGPISSPGGGSRSPRTQRRRLPAFVGRSAGRSVGRSVRLLRQAASPAAGRRACFSQRRSLTMIRPVPLLRRCCRRSTYVRPSVRCCCPFRLTSSSRSILPARLVPPSQKFGSPPRRRRRRRPGSSRYLPRHRLRRGSPLAGPPWLSP
jgi:hypothetical protein